MLICFLKTSVVYHIEVPVSSKGARIGYELIEIHLKKLIRDIRISVLSIPLIGYVQVS